jgi:hypothetical protein
MSEDNESFEERVRAIAREVSRSVERLTELDMDEIARAVGVDADRARDFVDNAGRWVSAHAETLGNEVGFLAGRPGPGSADAPTGRGAGPHPLDLPTADQGLALSALDSGRWTVGPGSNVLVAQGEGPAPAGALGLVGELRARDWIDANGVVTLVGRSALSRWVDTAKTA